ncbi:MAG: hypothetical protein LBJ25_02035 [Candidatus Margulisbacteria bacterium]|jgi:hypothetical protein|nr:hypothetical protein [Candidatus Margulisiibacteriota bacterium]
MVVPRLSFNEHIEQEHYTIKRPLSATQLMLNILESAPLTSREHSPELRFNAPQKILTLIE